MLHVDLNEKSAIATLKPDGALTKDDFLLASSIIDPFVEKSGNLYGIIIYVESFPGWDSFGALSSHLKFVNEHHKKVRAVAFVTNSALVGAAEHVAKHFVSAKIKSFTYDHLDEAKNWINEVNTKSA